MTTTAKSVKTPWWDVYFRTHRPFFGEIPAAETRRQVAYLVEKLGLSRGKSFLDSPCGVGRISIPLAKLGVKVTGVDLSPAYIDELNQTSARNRLGISTLRCDMRKVTFANKFDAAGNLGTSFGLFTNERDNLLCLQVMYRALKPGGKFVLHLSNRDWIVTHFTSHGWMYSENSLVLMERSFDYATSVLQATWKFYRHGFGDEYKIQCRLYSCHELIAMFRKVGFENVEAFGSTDNDPVSQNTKMNWVFGAKPR